MRLLIIACSNRKIRTRDLLPAIERYDGVAYRLLRKARREGRLPRDLDIAILSAKFGLIDAFTPIPWYNWRMDKSRAVRLRPSVQRRLAERLAQTSYCGIYIDLGEDYLPAIEGSVLREAPGVITAEGRIGYRLGRLKRWLISTQERT